MNEKELIRRALMGDKQAQELCTAKGIVLPCPKCFSSNIKIEGDGHSIYLPDTLGFLDIVPDSILYITCDDCDLCSSCITVEDGEKREDAEKRLIANWNTRPAPPVGKCRECKYCAGVEKNQALRCTLNSLGVEFGLSFIISESFCSYFEPREE